MSRIYGALAVAALALAATPSVAQIKIASVGPMTGQYAAFGEQLRKGAEMAVADINAAGGVNGQKLELTIGDDACDPKQATAVANKMVADKVVFVAGHYCSGSSIPASDIYKEAKILQITPASTNIRLTDEAFTKGNTTVFRTCGRDDVQGATVGAYILKHSKDKKVAILHDKSPYGKGVADETKKALNKGGLREAMYESYNDTDKDFTALINKMKQGKIDIIVLGGYHTAGALLIKQSREQGFGAQMVGFDALEDAEFGKLGGAATDGVLMSFPPKAEDDPKNAALVKKFRDAKYEPAGYTLFTYAAVKVWADAAKKANSIEAAKVAAALRAGTFDSAVGPLTYDQKGDIKDPVYDIYIWKGGKSFRRPSSRVTREQGPGSPGPFSWHGWRSAAVRRVLGPVPLAAGCVCSVVASAPSRRRHPSSRSGEFQPADVGTVVALVIAINQSLFAFAPVAFGWLRDLTQDDVTAFLVAAIAQLLAAALVVAGRRFSQPIQCLVGRPTGFRVLVTVRPPIWYPRSQSVEGNDRRDGGGHHRGRVGSRRLRPEGNSQERPAGRGLRSARSRHEFDRLRRLSRFRCGDGRRDRGGPGREGRRGLRHRDRHLDRGQPRSQGARSACPRRDLRAPVPRAQ
jgi:branched-chain amino acid transport system substrate-binding protein